MQGLSDNEIFKKLFHSLSKAVRLSVMILSRDSDHRVTSFAYPSRLIPGYIIIHWKFRAYLDTLSFWYRARMN